MKKKQCSKNKLFSPLAMKFLPYQLKVELVVVVVLLLAYVGRVDYSTVANMVFGVGFVVLAVMYYIITFKMLPEDTPMKTCLTYRLLGVGQAVSCIGIQFFLFDIEGARMVIMTGALTLGVASLSLVLARNLKTVGRGESQVDVIRGLVILGAVFWVLYH